jgi:hypothetical protein
MLAAGYQQRSWWEREDALPMHLVTVGAAGAAPVRLRECIDTLGERLRVPSEEARHECVVSRCEEIDGDDGS